MLEYQFRPLTTWPGEKTRSRQRSRFNTGFSDTLALLERELKHLQARRIVLQADVEASQIRQDGMLRASARPRSPAIILSFESKHGPLSYPCDRFSDWEDNLRAIALSLEALRTVDRYGVTRRAEQYRGWSQLPPPADAGSAPGDDGFSTPGQALEFLLRFVGTTLQGMGDRDALIRAAEFKSHPDRGGSAVDFKRVQAARAVLLKA